jgi:glycosyltransferase involved in cell wall biosynthesis
MPSVQVVLCARNSAATIEKSISSLLLEGISPQDIIVVDGLSEDATWKIASDAGCTGKGFVAARTMGIERVTSAFTLIIGPDDAMEPGSIQKLVDELRDNKNCAAVTAQKRVATELDNFLDKGMDFYYSLMPVGVVPVIGNPSLYRTHLLKQNKYDSRFAAN